VATPADASLASAGFSVTSAPHICTCSRRGAAVALSQLLLGSLVVVSGMVPSSGGPVLPFHKTFAASAIAACTAEIMTLPLGAPGLPAAPPSVDLPMSVQGLWAVRSTA
jgi:hypothetical protein